MAIQTTDKRCPICGQDVAEPTFKRFGEWACSEGHAEEFVKEVRSEKPGPGDRSLAVMIALRGRAAADDAVVFDPGRTREVARTLGPIALAGKRPQSAWVERAR
jgi:hypothetical protein